MRTIGLIGGLGPESTVDYYRALIASYQKRTAAKNLPSILIDSLDVYEGIRMLDNNQLEDLTEYLSHGIQRLADAGADFAIIAANSPHLVFDEVQNRSPLPLISIVEAACSAVQATGMTRVGLLGTRFTMQAGFYPKVFSRMGITLVTPAADEIAYIHDKYINELLIGSFLPETRDALFQIIERMREHEHIEAVVLAGTELPLILAQDTASGIPLLNTTQIHIEADVARLLD
jgi:aspartate racemase